MKYGCLTDCAWFAWLACFYS